MLILDKEIYPLYINYKVNIIDCIDDSWYTMANNIIYNNDIILILYALKDLPEEIREDIFIRYLLKTFQEWFFLSTIDMNIQNEFDIEREKMFQEEVDTFMTFVDQLNNIGIWLNINEILNMIDFIDNEL